MEQLLQEEQARSERKIIYTVSALLSSTVYCGACIQEPATIFCLDCPDHVFQEFCEACSAEEHTSKVTCKHRRVPIVDRPQKDIKCKTHSTQSLVLYCSECKEAVCEHCHKFGAHKTHDVILLQDLDDRVKREIDVC
jgi:hypothetical protein